MVKKEEVSESAGLKRWGVDLSSTKKVKFEESLGDADHWFTYKKLGLLPWEEIQAIIKSKKFANDKVRIGAEEVKSIAEVMVDTDATFELSMDLIESWNITDKHGVVLPIPSTDPTVRQRVAGVYLVEMHSIIQNDPLGLGFLSRAR